MFAANCNCTYHSLLALEKEKGSEKNTNRKKLNVYGSKGMRGSVSGKIVRFVVALPSAYVARTRLSLRSIAWNERSEME